MSKQTDNTPSRNEVHQRFSNAPWGAFAIAGAILIVGGAFVLSLPDHSDNPTRAVAPAVGSAEASTNAHATPDTADETSCNRQTWPYIDQRCAQRINAARDTRKVRIVTDKGDSVTAVTPVPVVEPKDKPKPAPQPAVAHNDSRSMGPAAAPSPPADEAPAPSQQTAAPPRPQQQQTAAPQNNPRQAAPAPAPVVATATPAAQPAPPPAATNAMAQDTNSKSGPHMKTVSVAPSAASAEPVSPGVDAMDNPPPKKSKAERAEQKKAKRDAKREAKRRQKNDDADEEIAAARPAPLEERGAREERRAREDSRQRRGRDAVPDDVLAEVERATRGREDGGSRRIVIGDPRGQRVIIVPRDSGGF